MPPFRLVLLAALLPLAGCEFFATREFSRKPSNVRSLPGLSRPGDSAAFRVIESLWLPGGRQAEEMLAEKRVTFSFAGDSIEGGDTLKVFSMRVTDAATGGLLEEGKRVLRLGNGVELRPAGPAAGGGARFYPMKAAAGASSPGAEGEFLALPPLFAEGLDWEDSLGMLAIARRLEGDDTLKYRGRLEESWRVAETVTAAGAEVATGRYWYGASGLIKAEQAWENFERRDAEGAAAGTAVLRRSLERL